MMRDEKRLKIPVSVDNGAKLYIWYSGFTEKNSLKAWWLDKCNLVAFEASVRTQPKFKQISSENEDSFFRLMNQSGLQIMLVNGFDSLCYLVCGNQKIYKDGTIKHYENKHIKR